MKEEERYHAVRHNEGHMEGGPKNILDQVAPHRILTKLTFSAPMPIPIRSHRRNPRRINPLHLNSTSVTMSLAYNSIRSTAKPDPTSSIHRQPPVKVSSFSCRNFILSCDRSGSRRSVAGMTMPSPAMQLLHTAVRSSSRIMDPSFITLRSVSLRPQSITKLFLGRSTRDGAGVTSMAGRVVIALKDPAAQDSLKRAVAKKAVELVKSGMVLGLGTGSTSQFFIEELGILLLQNKLKDVECVATSYQSRVLSRQFGVKTLDLNDVNHIDIAFDGADEVDSSMNLIKGGGAAHTMEKVVDSMAKQCVILVDETKVVKTLGLTFPVPVEVLPFALAPVLRTLAALGGQPEIRTALRKDGPVMTDLGNMVVDVRFPEGVQNPAELEKKINMIPGVVENGIFTNVAHTVLVGTKDGLETSVVEFADFVETLRSSEQVSAA